MLLVVYEWMTADPAVRVNDFVQTLDEYCLDLVNQDVLNNIRMDPMVEENGSECKIYWNFILSHYVPQQKEPSVNNTVAGSETGMLSVLELSVSNGGCSIDKPVSNCKKECNQERAQKRRSHKFNKVQSGRSFKEYEPSTKRSTEDNVSGRSVILEIDLTEEHAECEYVGRRTINTSTSASSQKLYFISGIVEKNLSALDLKKSQVESIVGFPFKDNCSALIYQTDFILVMCASVTSNGQGKHGTTSIVRYLSLNEKVWKIGPPIILSRSQFGCVFGDDALYVLGGMQKDESACNTVERLRISAGHILGNWEKIAEIPFHRYYSVVGFLDNKIYVVGGQSPYHSSQMCCSDSVYELNLQTKEWTRKAKMRRRIGFSIITFKPALYAIGGGGLSSPWGIKCDVYHPKANRWRTVAPLKKPPRNAGNGRCNSLVCLEFGTFLYGGRIHVVGGHPGCPTVEVYNDLYNILTQLTKFPLPVDA
ncbi:unnamed protein product [Allacma fusca]|uniref:Uncharacterized protein n=1 Tax=Allacma fusca TaxID=39272 RepID=A0A8J2JLA1_9HEXA|nr:unnamed protein product [Allacma fusca]